MQTNVCRKNYDVTLEGEFYNSYIFQIEISIKYCIFITDARSFYNTSERITDCSLEVAAQK